MGDRLFTFLPFKDIETVPKERVFSPSEIKKLADKHQAPPFSPRDAALVAMAGMAYFNATELSLLKVSELISEKGQLRIEGYTPSAIHPHNKERYFVIGRDTALREKLTDYIAWRHEHSLLLLDRGLYAGLDPNSRFFLKDSGEEFILNFKSAVVGKETKTQALQMQRHFQKFHLGEGGSLRSLNESFIQNFWRTHSQHGTTITVRNLVELTGLTAETLRQKCIREPVSVQEVLEGLYK